MIPVTVGAPVTDGSVGAVYSLWLKESGTLKKRHRIDPTLNGLSSSGNVSFGRSVAYVDDLDGDGAKELAIGAWNDNTRGAVHILHLNQDGTVKGESNPLKIDSTNSNISTLREGDRFGSSLTSLGQPENDGTIVLAVGARLDDTGASNKNRGAVHLLFIETKVTPGSLADAVETLPDDKDTLETFTDGNSVHEWIDEIEALPEYPRPNEVVTIILNLEEGDYTGLDVIVPSGYLLVINGESGSVEFAGASPALTVVSGNVLVTGGVTFTNATDAPTILVLDGSLTLRDAIVEETTIADQPAIEVRGGSVDLGTATDSGGNTIIIRGAGDLIRNANSASASPAQPQSGVISARKPDRDHLRHAAGTAALPESPATG